MKLVPRAASVCSASLALRNSSPPGCCFPSKPRCLYNGMLIMLERLQNAPQPLQFNDCRLLARLSVHANDERFLGGHRCFDSFPQFRWLRSVRKEKSWFLPWVDKIRASLGGPLCFVLHHCSLRSGRSLSNEGLPHTHNSDMSSHLAEQRGSKTLRSCRGTADKGEERGGRETRRSGWDSSLPFA